MNFGFGRIKCLFPYRKVQRLVGDRKGYASNAESTSAEQTFAERLLLNRHLLNMTFAEQSTAEHDKCLII